MFQITRAIWVGPYASPQRAPKLAEAGITHVFNVGDAPSVLTVEDGPFVEVSWRPIIDLARMPDEIAFTCLRDLHAIVRNPSSRIYVHCMAGWNRSPAVIFLYLVACGVSPASAKEIIESRAHDAVAPHPRLVDRALIESARQLGASEFLPHPRPEAIVAV